MVDIFLIGGDLVMRNLLKIGLILAAFAVAAPVLAQEQSGY